jgi:hypothetical protein
MVNVQSTIFHGPEERELETIAARFPNIGGKGY